jgi:hypothetical protein
MADKAKADGKSDDRSEGKGGSVIIKVIAAVFGAIIAPLIVALAIKYIEKDDKDKEKEKPAVTAVQPEKVKEVPTPPVTQPEKPLIHFNGKDLSGFYTFLKDHGRDQDPRGVFTVKDGILRISGEEPGYLATQRDYSQYQLIAEYRWGEKTWGGREDKARSSSIIVHASGPDGAVGGTLMSGFQVLVKEGRTGTFYLPKGPLPLKLTVDIDPQLAKPRPAPPPSGPAKENQKAANPKKGKMVWWWVFKPGGTRTQLKDGGFVCFPMYFDTRQEDTKGFRGKADVEKPVGQWNTLEITCSINRFNLHQITVVLNGTRVNLGYQAAPTGGKILIRSEGAEIFFRKFEVKSVKK